jgi:CxxC motif-containing protein (DUF1111 family)
MIYLRYEGGTVRIEYQEIEGRFADGEPFRLRKPEYTFDNLAYGEMDASYLADRFRVFKSDE